MTITRDDLEADKAQVAELRAKLYFVLAILSLPLNKIDQILGEYNEERSGEDIRLRMRAAGENQ